MHPEVVQDTPGICPICGMSLEAIEFLDDDVENTEYRDMRRRFWLGLVFSLPVVLLAFGGEVAGRSDGKSDAIQFFFATPVVFWAGWPFLERAWLSVLNRSLNMFTLIALGVGAAYFYSLAAVFFPEIFPDSFKKDGSLFVYFEAASVITVLVLLGQVLELKAKNRTHQAIKALLVQAAKTAHLVIEEQELEVSIEEVKPGDVLRVKPGEKIPVDGIVNNGAGLVDESMLTGEAMLVQKNAQDFVYGSTINQSGSFLMEAKKVGSETVFARIIQMVSEAQRSRAPIQKIADSVSGVFVPGVVLISLFTFMIWAAVGPEPRHVYAFLNAVAVLIIACPCALGLATPVSIMVGVGKGAAMGVLIKNAEALECLEKVDTVIMDKTGTMTEGKPKVVQIFTVSPHTDQELVQIAASVEKNSEHPIALAIMEEAKERKAALSGVLGFTSIQGKGISGTVEGRNVFIGKADLQYQIPPEMSIKIKEAQENAQTVVVVCMDGNLMGAFSIADPIKPSAPDAVRELHKMGIKVVMLTGDNTNTATAVARQLGIDEIHAEVNPEEKNRWVHTLKQEGRVVAMAGDGINDSPALAAADVGIAMGTGTDVAMESAGVTLVKGNLTGIVRSIALSKAVMRNIRQNLFFAFVYNTIGIPIAAGILYPVFGLLLNPMIASAAMALSSVSVIVNALRLNRIKL